MKLKYLLAASMLPLAAAVVLPAPAAAQSITSGISGRVTDASGTPLGSATVTVTDVRTGASRTITTDGEGRFRAAGLPTGGPYTVSSEASGFEGQSAEGIYITLQGDTALTFTMQPGSGEIVVTAANVGATQLVTGPGLNFGENILTSFPSITRDIRDIIRIDPRVSLDRDGEVDRISCLGGNDRTNTFTVDGIVQADTFGLNGTPFAARNAMPIPYDVIRETSVEFAPFDVEYSDFTGCLINVVTKSGANDWHGSAFYAYRDENLRGDTIDGVTTPPAPFKEKRWGATISGPILPDRLFFFFGYEQTDLGSTNDFGPNGSGYPNEVSYVTQAEFDRFAQIAKDVYGQDIGGLQRALPEASVRYFGRLDAYLTDRHRLEMTYQRLEETNVTPDAGSQQFTGYNSYLDEGTLSDYYSARLFSEWSDTISTELRLSRSEVGDVQGPVGGGEAQSGNPIVRLAVGVDGANSPFSPGMLTTGPGISRTSNQLDQRIDQAKFQVNVDLGAHLLKFGTEVNDVQVYNLFAQNSTGTIFFRNLDDFEAGLVSGGANIDAFASSANVVNGSYGGAVIAATGSGDINDAAARFGRTIWSVYAQDNWQATDQLQITAGIRAQFYSGDAPRENPNFVARYGFSNSVGFSDLDPVILPRLGFTYDLLDNEGLFSNTSFKGGVGMFSGGDPLVYFSNAFSNNGYSTGTGTTNAAACAPLKDGNGQIDVVTGGVFTGFPQCALDQAKANGLGGLADTQSTDPNFKLPTALRANFGVTTTLGSGNGFFDNWRLNADYIFTRFINPINWVDLSQVVNPARGLNGYTVDGRPIYAAIDPTRANCNAELLNFGGTNPQWNNVTAACFGTSRDDELQLTNGPDHNSHVVSFVLSKQFDGGIFTSGGGTSVSMGYAWMDSDNFRNANSSTATSSYDEAAMFDRQNPTVGTSNFETKHRFSLAVNFEEEFFKDHKTQLGIFFSARSGRPYSYTFDNGGVLMDSASGEDNALLYVPSGPNDPNVVYADLIVNNNVVQTAAQARDGLDAYINGNKCISKYRGKSIPANNCTEDWVFDMDMRISQEIPGFMKFFGQQSRFEVFADIDNFLNLLDSSWNTFRYRGIWGDGQLVDVIDLDTIDSQGRYVLKGFSPDDAQRISTSSSVWKIQVGVRYSF